MPRIEPSTRPINAFVPVSRVACTTDGQDAMSSSMMLAGLGRR
jgi:hypothetical protein